MPTLTLPTATGTLTITSDAAAAVAGTAGKLAKFTGANTVGDSLVSESGSTVTTTGAHTITGLLQAGTKIIDISRDVAGGAIGNYTEIGNFNNTYGAHALRVTLTLSPDGASIAKEYLVVTKNALTSNWVICPATRNTG